MAADDSQQALRQMTAAVVDLAAAAPDEAQTVTQVMLHVNQLSAILAGHTDAGDAHRVLNSLYGHLARLAGRGGSAAQHVQSLLVMLNELAASGSIYASPVPHRLPQARKAAGATRYAVRKGARGERLVESREGSEKDFYVTKQDFDAVVDALIRTARPHVRFEALHDAFLKAGGSNIKSAYPLRVVLRFLRQLQPPLIAGQRGSYSLAVKGESFRKQAKQAWDRLA